MGDSPRKDFSITPLGRPPGEQDLVSRSVNPRGMHARSCALGSTAARQRAASLPDPPEGRHCRTPARDCPPDKSSDAALQVEVWAGRAGFRGI